MQKINRILLPVLMLIPLSVLAEYQLKDKSEIIGSWIVESTAPKLQGTRRPSTQEMEFKADGSYISSAIDHRAGSSRFSASSTFTVENGILKVGKPGRPGKFDRFIIYQKDGDSMILKGGSEGFYFLRKK